MRFTRPIFVAVLLALGAIAAGCSSSEGGSGYGPRDSTEKSGEATATTPTVPPGASAQACSGTVAGTSQLRVTGVGCDVGRGVVAAWDGEPACTSPAGASRFSCAVHDGYRCIGAATERGIAVSCARQGSSAAFLARHR